MTINKAQGQTLSCVGVDLTDACFTHGQLYVAASRVGKAEHLRFAVDPDDDGAYRTRNVVFREALTVRPVAPTAAATAAPDDFDDDDSPELDDDLPGSPLRPRRPLRRGDVSAPPGTDAAACGHTLPDWDSDDESSPESEPMDVDDLP